MKCLTLVTILALLAPGCSSNEPTIATGDLVVESDAFESGGEIPERHTCDGDDLAPPLRWGSVEGTKTFVVTLTDPDAGGFAHWVLFSIPAGTTAVQEDSLPPEAAEGTNAFGELGYRGPCPPLDDEAHDYVFTVYALDDEPTGLEEGDDLAAVLDAIEPSVIESGTLTASYDRR